MITSLLEAPKQVRVSAPALSPKGKSSNALVNFQVSRIIGFGITKRGVVYMRYGTTTGRGCSFISFEKLLKALLELSGGSASRPKADVVAYLCQIPQIFPALANWNNKQLVEGAWQEANDEFVAHLEVQVQAAAPESPAGIAKCQLLEEIEKRGLVAFPTQEDGEWFIKVCTHGQQVLGHAIASSDGRLSVVANAPKAKEVFFFDAKSAIESLIAEKFAQQSPEKKTYYKPPQKGINYVRRSDEEIQKELEEFMSRSRGIIALSDGTVAIDHNFYRLMGSVSQVRGNSMRRTRLF